MTCAVLAPKSAQVRSRAAIKASAQLGAMSADTARALLNKMAEEAAPPMPQDIGEQHSSMGIGRRVAGGVL